MKHKITVFVLMLLIAGIAIFHASGQVASGNGQEKDTDPSIRQLAARVATLENQVATLQKQIKALEQKSPQVLAIPDTKFAPGKQMPPGARQHEIGGIKYWTIPLRQGQ